MSFTDTFTDTDSVAITSHTAADGTTWVKHGSAGNAAHPIIYLNRIVPGENNTQADYRASWVPAGADYTVTALAEIVAVNNGNIAGVGARMSTTTAAGYRLVYNSNFGTPFINLAKHDGSSDAYVATGPSVTLGVGTYYMTIEPVGSVISCRIQRTSDNNWLTSGGTWQSGQVNCISYTDGTPISAAGRAGIVVGTRAPFETAIDSVTGADYSAAPVITGPSGAPGAATSTKTVAENSTAVHTFTADVAVTWSKNGGADAALFNIDSSTGALTFAAAPDYENPTDADTNNTYIVVVRATATVGGSTADQTVTVTVTNATEVPLAPTIGTATAGNASASVAFTPPSNTGRPAITGYTATSSPGGLTGTGASSPITVSGLTNGTAYTFTVTATNADGTGPASAASNSVTPSAGGDTTAPSITSTGTGSTNGPFSATVAENSTSTFITFTSDEALASVTKAGTNGASYTLAGTGLTRTLARTTGFDYEAWVLAGSVPEVVTLAFADAAANVRNVTVNISPTNVNEPPSAPTIGVAGAGDQTVSIAFTAPVNTGKPTITGYTATLSPGGITKTGASSPIVFGAGDGIVNGTAYTGVVKATNSEGTGPDSASSNSVTPSSGAPTGATIYSEPLANNDNVLKPDTSLLWVGVRDFLTGTPIALHTGITTDSSAQFSLYDSGLSVGGRYLVDWVTADLEHGRAEAVGE